MNVCPVLFEALATSYHIHQRLVRKVLRRTIMFDCVHPNLGFFNQVQVIDDKMLQNLRFYTYLVIRI